MTSAASEPQPRSASSTPMVRGALLFGIKQWALSRYGPSGFAELVAMLPQDELATWETAVMINSTMHRASLFKNVCAAIIQKWGAGDPRSICQTAGAIAIGDLATYMKILMKIGTPSFVTTRFSKVWSHYFSAGELRLIDRSGHGAVLELTGWEPYGDGGSYGAEGWMSAAIEYSGGRNIRCAHTINAQRTHRYEFTWA